MTDNISDERTDGDSEANDRGRSTGSASGAVEALTDPERLRGRGIEFVDERMGEDFAAAEFHDGDIAGRALLGITNDDGAVLLLEHEDQPPILPMCGVDEGDDWAAVGRGTVDDVPGLEATLAGVERVRTAEYPDGGEWARNYYVVFEGAVAGAERLPEEPTVKDEAWEADWYDAVPEAIEYENMTEDIELFVDD
jgi:hypothetical protein